MSGSTLIGGESAGAAASLLEPGAEGPLALSVQTTLSLDAVITSAASPDSTFNEADQDDYLPAGATPSEESADAVSGPSIDSLADFAVDEDLSVAVAADITGSAPDGDETEQVSAGPIEVPSGEVGNDPVNVAAVEATADQAPEAASDESGEAAPATSMAMSVDTGATFDGAMGAGLVYGGCWSEPIDGGDGSLDWAYTRPYVIGDVTEDIFYDIYPLPVEGDGGYKEESDGWLYVEETDEWVYLGGDEDWIYLDEWEDGGYVEEDWSYLDDGEDWVPADEGEEWLYEDGDWIYLDEWEDPGYIDEDGVYADEGEDWVYLDEWEDWGYGDEGDEAVYAEEGDVSIDLMDGEAGDTFTAAILPLAVDHLFIA